MDARARAGGERTRTRDAEEGRAGRDGRAGRTFAAAADAGRTRGRAAAGASPGSTAGFGLLFAVGVGDECASLGVASAASSAREPRTTTEGRTAGAGEGEAAEAAETSSAAPFATASASIRWSTTRVYPGLAFGGAGSGDASEPTTAGCWG